MRAYKAHDNILIYGAPGTGKTHLAATIAKDKYTLLFDVEHGARTLNNIPEEYRKNIVVLQYTEFADLDKIYKLLEKNDVVVWNKYMKSIGVDVVIERPFEAVIVDTISELQRQMEIELSPTSFKDMLRDPNEIKPLRIQDWGAVSTLTEMVITEAFGRLPIIFIALAHEQYISEEESNKIIAGTPKLRGKLALDVGKHFDFVGRLTYAKTGQRVLMTAGQDIWQAKTRGKHKPLIPNATMEDIL